MFAPFQPLAQREVVGIKYGPVVVLLPLLQAHCRQDVADHDPHVHLANCDEVEDHSYESDGDEEQEGHNYAYDKVDNDVRGDTNAPI